MDRLIIIFSRTQRGYKVVRIGSELSVNVGLAVVLLSYYAVSKILKFTFFPPQNPMFVINTQYLLVPSRPQPVAMADDSITL